MSVTCQEAMAKIALNKSLLKEYSTKDYPRVVYLNDGSEFQIQLFNSTTKIIAAKIFLNGESLEDLLVLRPAERFWLERFFNKSKKFKFSTYEMDNNDVCRSIEKAAENGDVRIEFYNIKPKRTQPIQLISTINNNPWQHTYYYNTSIGSSDCNIKDIKTFDKSVNYSNSASRSSDVYISEVGSSCATLDSLSCAPNIDISACSAKFTASSTTPKTIETGRIDEGSYSNQKFSYVDYDFESYPFHTEDIRILPASRKVIESNDLRKRYCSYCGKKLSPKNKYCPNCGNKVE